MEAYEYALEESLGSHILHLSLESIQADVITCVA
jgi:hypothetical protein